MTYRHIGAEELSQRIRAYVEEENDVKAAKRLEITTTAFKLWRNRLRLPAKRKPGYTNKMLPPLYPMEAARWRLTYLSSTSDVDAARKIGVSTAVFNNWRIAMGLPNKCWAGKRTEKSSTNEHEVSPEAE